MREKIAIYPGTFDPVHNGHLDTLEEASKIFTKVIWAIGVNSAKKPMFSVGQRLEMLRLANRFPNVEIAQFSGLLIRFAESIGAEFIVRSLRTAADFDYEFTMSLVNKKINPQITTIYLFASQNNLQISSTLVRELILNNESIDRCVPPETRRFIDKIRRRYRGH